MTQFSDLGLADPILKAVAEQGYSQPSPVQAQAIPAVLAGRDVMAAAQTGTGKTAGFTLPLLHRLLDGKRANSNRIRALILTPTRELAAQVGDNVREYSKYLNLSCAVVFGGVGINPQMMTLRRGVDILVACPGRLLDLYQQNAVRFDQVECLVLDEADRMLDMGFIHDIKKVLALLPAKRQNLMFSATFSPEIRELAKGLVNDPLEIDVSPRNSTAHTVEQWVVPADKKQKARILAQMLKDNGWKQVLVFTRTKHGANRLSHYLEEQGITSAPIHGNKSQGARTRALADFKSGAIAALVATDIAARGLDIEQLPHVVNFELPNVAADYVHRIGRTGRAGASGEAVSLVCIEEIDDLEGIEGLIGKNIERRVMSGFEPVAALPPPRPPKAPKKPKKAKQPKDHKDTFTREPRSGGGRSENRGAGRSESRGDSAKKAARPASGAAKKPRPEGAGNGAAKKSDGGNGNSRSPWQKKAARPAADGDAQARAPRKREHRHRDGE